MPTLDEIFAHRAGRGVEEQQQQLGEAGVSYGSAQPWTPPDNPSARALVETIKARWHAEMNAARAWSHAQTAPILADDLPGWMLAHLEREPVPEAPGWLRELAAEPEARGEVR